MFFFILDLCSQRPQQVCSQSGRCHVIRTGTRAVPHQVAVAPLIILSPIVTRCNSPSHDWWCRCLITPRQNPPKITFRSRGQLRELHEVRWTGWRGGCVAMLSCCHMHVRFVLFLSRNQHSVINCGLGQNNYCNTVMFLYVHAINSRCPTSLAKGNLISLILTHVWLIWIVIFKMHLTRHCAKCF